MDDVEFSNIYEPVGYLWRRTIEFNYRRVWFFALSAGFLACCSSTGERRLCIMRRIILDRFKKYLYLIFIGIRITAFDNNRYFF